MEEYSMVKVRPRGWVSLKGVTNNDIFYYKVLTFYIFYFMSEQPGGFLQMNASYNFDRNKLNNYRHKTIASEGFQKWTHPNMYKSSYAHYHSKVRTFLDRTQWSLKIQLCLVMEGTFLI